MKRQGMYTGNIYTERDFEKFKIKECCVLISDNECTDEKNKARYEKIHNKCIDCSGCPEKLKDEKKSEYPFPLNLIYGILKKR